MNILGDDLLEEYMVLDFRIKELTKRHNEIKTLLKETGTFATDKHVCIVSDAQRTSMCSVGKAVEALGEILLKSNGLIQTTMYTVVKVERKA